MPSSGSLIDCSYLPWVPLKSQAQTRFLHPGKQEVAPETLGCRVITDRTLVGSCQRVDRIQPGSRPEGTPETKAQLRWTVYHHEEQNDSSPTPEVKGTDRVRATANSHPPRSVTGAGAQGVGQQSPSKVLATQTHGPELGSQNLYKRPDVGTGEMAWGLKAPDSFRGPEFASLHPCQVAHSSRGSNSLGGLHRQPNTHVHTDASIHINLLLKEGENPDAARPLIPALRRQGQMGLCKGQRPVRATK